ncbi:MAG: type II toxin-antitoxin system prevent-host-death family antitoxin [Peptococcaceae bacterium]|jgi:prevent-host-death family protein|nr:type II toxin-antitoxin system prevent-host-death family antitoxin [Peptococcaceae bacterium]
MFVTATEFKNNIGKYLALVSVEDVFVTKNGRGIAKLSDISSDRQSILDDLVGLTSANPISLDEAKAARAARQ